MFLYGSKFWFFLFAIVYSISLLTFSYTVEPMHDYALYFRHWDLVLSGGDPWKKIEAANAYGPVYNLFAWLYQIDHQFPKLAFVSSWLFIAIYSMYRFLKDSKASVTQKWLFFIFWFFNPFFLLSTVFYGFNDSFVALLVFIGLFLILQYKDRVAGVVIITLGVLTKLYPLFLLPYVSRNKQQLLKLSLIFLLLLILTYLVTYLVWGGSFANAFGKANGRDPTLFSIMRFVNGAYFPSEFLAQVIIGLTNLLVLLGVGYVFKLFWNGKIEQHTAFLAGFTMLLMFYKAGQQQFYLTYFAIFAVWCLWEFKKEIPNLKAFYSILVLGLWFALMAGVVYPLTHRMEGDYLWLRDLIGLPTFVILFAVVYFLLKPPIDTSIKNSFVRDTN